MLGSILSVLIISGICLPVFMSCFLEYYVARYDLSEAQVTRILKDLPSFYEPYLLVRNSSVEDLVKKASMPISLMMMLLTTLCPVAIIANIYLALSDNKIILSFALVLILFGYSCVVLRFFQALWRAQ